jgi:hypothetical protein
MRDLSVFAGWFGLSNNEFLLPWRSISPTTCHGCRPGGGGRWWSSATPPTPPRPPPARAPRWPPRTPWCWPSACATSPTSARHWPPTSGCAAHGWNASSPRRPAPAAPRPPDPSAACSATSCCRCIPVPGHRQVAGVAVRPPHRLGRPDHPHHQGGLTRSCHQQQIPVERSWRGPAAHHGGVRPGRLLRFHQSLA